VRPEFVKVSKKNEVQRYKTSASEGIVERVAFRGDRTEITVKVNDNILTAKRGLDEAPITVGEKVDVLIYRMFVTSEDTVYLLENQALVEDFVYI
jgi:sulfate transport system ATP-binding protein